MQEIRNNIKPKETIELFIQADDNAAYNDFNEILQKQVNAKSIEFTDSNIAGTIVITNEKDKFYIKSEFSQSGDTSALKAELEKDLSYQKNFFNLYKKN